LTSWRRDMPETPDVSPRHRWALDSAYGAVHRRRRSMLCDTSSLTASSVWVYLDANWSFYRRCSPCRGGAGRSESARKAPRKVRLSLGGHC